MGFLHMKRYYDLFEASYTEKEFRNILEAIVELLSLSMI